MKHLMVIMILGSIFTGTAFAAQVDTECPFMAESNERVNTKNSLKTKQVKTSKESGATKG